MTEPSYVPAIETVRAEFEVPGVSWAVIEDGEIAATGSAGVLTSGEGEPVTSTTRFQACSISKPIAALAMLRLVDRGLLDLDADINDTLTSWQLPRNGDWQPVVTLRQLVSHSAGLTTSGFPGYRRTDELPTTVQILRGMHPANTFDVRVDTVPGTQFRYSGGGTLAMQLLLEDVTGTPFPELMRELVLDPLGMAESDYTQPAPEAAHDVLASGHGLAGAVVPGGWHVYPEIATAVLWTTPSDLCRYALAVRAAYAGEPGALLPQPLAREMLTPQVPASDRIGGLSAIGLGPFLSDSGSPRFGHSGGNEGFSCHLLAYLDLGAGAAVMTNSDRGGPMVHRAFAAIAEANDWPDFPMNVTDLELPTDAVLASVAGRYLLRDRVEVAIEPAGHGLQVRLDRQQPMTFGFVGTTEAGSSEFASNVTDTKLRVESADAIVFVQNDQELVCPRT